MSAFDGNSARQLVPRWRNWRTTVLLGECSGGHRFQVKAPAIDKESALAKYRERPNAGRASELFTTALMYDLRDERFASIACEFSNDPLPLLRALAEATNMKSEQRARALLESEPTDPQVRVAYLKMALARHPRNPFRWADLAREYTVLAQPRKATQAMRAALAIAPGNRFVLRSAAALFVHTDELDKALHYLQTAPKLTTDPWILAPYVAVSELAEQKRLHHRETMRLLEDDNFGLRDRAELAAALGTSEVHVGSGRRGRQLLRMSAENPTDNSLAQVEWMSVQLNSRLIEDSLPVIPHDFEAQARRAAYEGRWQDAVASSAEWLDDQPFSPTAASFGSFSASMFEDWGSTIRMAEDGLSANPGDPILLNNKALALVEIGELKEAIKILMDCRNMNVDGRNRAVLNATEGMLFFRAGRADEGRRRYKSTISYFTQLRESSTAAHAALMLAYEEKLACTPEIALSLESATKLIGEYPTSDLVTLQGRISLLSRRERVGNGIVSIEMPQLAEPLLKLDVASEPT